MKYIKKICIIYQERIGELFMDKAIWNLTDIYKDEDGFLNDKKQIQEKQQLLRQQQMTAMQQ